MSAVSALRGYRTQFLYSLHYILAHQNEAYRFRLEGNEDLDILNSDGHILFVIQVKNLVSPIVLSDLIAERKTSFLKRYLHKSTSAIPILVSFGTISADLKVWKNNDGNISNKEKKLIQKYGLTEAQWKNIWQRIQLIEVNEDQITNEILSWLKEYSIIDPVPTIDILLYWLHSIAEKSVSFTTRDLFEKIDQVALYLSERISISEQYGVYIKPLKRDATGTIDLEKLKEEFFQGTSVRYEHILFDLDVLRPSFTEEIQRLFASSNVVIVQGASGQGKSTLAYRFARESTPTSLVFELLIQEDPQLTNKCILSILAIARNIGVPVLFILNVNPASTQWTKIINSFANHVNLKFLVTIRQEDWHRAIASGINFSFESIELELHRNEARLIYDVLGEHHNITHYANFEEAWIKLGTSVPLLEFVYSMVHGDSLKNRLKQQVLQLVKEDCASNNENQIELLRLVAISDAYGGRVEIAKLNGYTHLQFILEKFEREYLIKHTEDKKFISGLHPIRSKILSELTFDEQVVFRRDYILKAIRTISERDVYLFLLRCFCEGTIVPEDVLLMIKAYQHSGWTLYNAICNSLFWVGVRDYIELNKGVLNECYDRYGDAWLFMLDLYHGNTLDITELQKSLNFSDEYLNVSLGLNNRLSAKTEVYRYVSNFLQEVPFPKLVPVTVDDWQSFGALLFWSKQIPSDQEMPVIDESGFEKAFVSLDVFKLSKLAFGMFHYSDRYNSIRLGLMNRFLDKVRDEFVIPVITVNEEVSVHYIVDMTNGRKGYSLHDRVIEIIDVLRYGLPDKEKYNTQGHGHHLKILPLSHDATHKTIPEKNLPIEEWVTINSLHRNLYEFQKRAEDWDAFFKELNQLETRLYDLIMEINSSLLAYHKDNSSFQPLLAIAKNIVLGRNNILKEPQCISDPLGINYKKIPEEKDGDSITELRSKYEGFFKNLRDFQAAIDNFIRQSAEVVANKVYPNNISKTKDSMDLEHISLVNLFNAIEKISALKTQKEADFAKFIQPEWKHLTMEDLITTAVLWRDFLNSSKASFNKVLTPLQRFSKLRYDFEEQIARKFKSLAKGKAERIEYISTDKTLNKPIILIHSENPASGLIHLNKAYTAIKEAISVPEYTSLKQLMLQTYFPKFYFILLTHGKVVRKTWYELPLFKLRDTAFKTLPIYYFVQTEIDRRIAENLKIIAWSDLFPEIDNAEKFASHFASVRLFTEHLADLKFFLTSDLDTIGEKMVKKHVSNIEEEIKTPLQKVLDFLVLTQAKFPFDEQAYVVNELEREYWRTLLEIRKGIFPTDKGDEVDYSVILTVDDIISWAERLNQVSESIGIFIYLLYGKYIQSFLATQKSDLK